MQMLSCEKGTPEALRAMPERLPLLLLEIRDESCKRYEGK